MGSLPSPKSRQQGFYYAHPQNRFWRLMAALCGAQLPKDIPAKKALLLSHGLALWDVLQSATIQGAADATIKNPVAVDLTGLLARAPIQAVFCNGAAAHRLYQTHLQPRTGIAAHRLPSTSPANAAFSLEKLQQQWGEALNPWILL